MLRMKLVMQFIFYMQISMEACYKLILRFFDGYSQVPKKASVQCLYNIPKKVKDEGGFCDTDKHKSFLTVDFNTLGIKVFNDVTGMIMKT